MAGYLVYWKTYWEDDPNPARRQRNPGWHTHRESFANAIEPDDEVWVVTVGGAEAPSEWRLLEQLVVLERHPRQIESRHGQFRIIACPERSRLFDPRVQADFSPVLQSLQFASGRSITAEGRLIGQTLQSPRPLSAADVSRLSVYSAKLALRARPGLSA